MDNLQNKKQEIIFTPLNLQTWKRGEMFFYFSKMAPTGYSLTVDLDISKMKKILEEANMKLFPAYIWLVTKNLNLQTEFKVAEKDGQLGYYNTLTPLYATFHNDDKTFSMMWTEYDDDFFAFYQAYLKNQQEYGNNHGVLAQKGVTPPENAYTVSCIPWITFKHFAVHSYENKPYYFPSIEAGKIYQKSGKLMLPFSMTCHHATTDGYHINNFLQQLQSEMDMFNKFI